MSDLEILKLAAKAAVLEVNFEDYTDPEDWFANGYDPDTGDVDKWWNPLRDDGDRLRLARALGINIDFADCSAWKRLPGGALIQENWGEDWGDEAHAIVRAAAEIGRAMP